MNNKSTNLQMTRFAAAVLVMIHHAFILIEGNLDHEWLWYLTRGQLNLGEFAVAVFFLCGGYLTAKSIQTAENKFGRYIWLRLGRIVPALAFVVIISVVMGAFISSESAEAYFTDRMTFRYLLNSIMILQHNLPGVFANAAYTSTINGSLWTLPVEFLCNIGCFVIWRTGFLNQEKFHWSIPLALAGSVGIWLLGSKVEILRALLRPCGMFYVGMAYWVYRDMIKLRRSYAWTALIVCACTGIFGILEVGIMLFLPYACMVFWFGCRQKFRRVSKLGQYTYAMYLWGFPVQQVVAESFAWSLSPYLDMIISIPAAMGLAVFTFYLIEKPAYKYCQKIMFH